jgi:type IV secretory pathway VirB2 component (pilin)
MTKSNLDSSMVPRSVFFVMLSLVMVMLPDLAFALGGPHHSVIGTTLCKTAGWFTGNTGKGIACFGVIILGTAALYGKITWAAAAIVGVGIAAVFGAESILTKLSFINCTATFS